MNTKGARLGSLPQHIHTRDGSLRFFFSWMNKVTSGCIFFGVLPVFSFKFVKSLSIGRAPTAI